MTKNYLPTWFLSLVLALSFLAAPTAPAAAAGFDRADAYFGSIGWKRRGGGSRFRYECLNRGCKKFGSVVYLRQRANGLKEEIRAIRRGLKSPRSLGSQLKYVISRGPYRAFRNIRPSVRVSGDRVFITLKGSAVVKGTRLWIHGDMIGQGNRLTTYAGIGRSAGAAKSFSTALKQRY